MVKKTNIDDAILKMLAEVETRKTAIGKLQRPQWRTTCSLQIPLFADRVNIQVVRDHDVLRLASGYMQLLQQMWDAGGSQACLPHTDPTWQSYPVEDWLRDIELRVSILGIKAEQDKLKDLQQRLDKIVSPEQRREIELAAIAKELS